MRRRSLRSSRAFASARAGSLSVLVCLGLFAGCGRSGFRVRSTTSSTAPLPPSSLPTCTTTEGGAFATLDTQAARFRSLAPREAELVLPLPSAERRGSLAQYRGQEATAVAIGSSASATVGAVSHRGWLTLAQVWPSEWQRRIRIGSSRLMHVAVGQRWLAIQLQAAGTRPPHALVFERPWHESPPQQVALPTSSGSVHVLDGKLWVPWRERQLTAIELRNGLEKVHALAPQPVSALGCYKGRLTGISPERQPIAISEGAPSVHQALWLKTAGQLLTAQARSSSLPRWLWASESTIYDVTYSAGAVLACSGDGLLSFLDARSGSLQRQIRVQDGLLQCAFDGPRWLSAVGWEEPSSTTLLRQLRQALLSGMAEVPQQLALVQQVDLQTHQAATQVLLDVASSTRVSRSARDKAAELLMARPSGHAEVALLALQRDPSPSSELPVGALAHLLGRSRHPGGARAMAARLLSPDLSGLQAAQVVAALGPLAGKEQLRPLLDFFTVHRASAASKEWVEAINSAADTLFRVGGSAEQEVLKLAASDPLTTQAVRRYLQHRLSASGPPTGRPQRTAVD